MNQMKSASGLSLIFEGGNEVQATSVARAIEGLVDLTNIVSTHAFPDADVRLSVKAVSPGSLEIDFIATMAATAQTVLTTESLTTANTIASLIAHGFKLKRFLFGAKPKSIEKSGDSVIVESARGDKITVPKGASLYFQEQKMDERISYIINNAAASPGVTGIRVSGEGVTEEIPREEFEICGRFIPVLTEEDKKIKTIRRDEILFVRKPDITGDTPWTFRTDRNITAEIRDDSFKAAVHAGGVSFTAGSYIIADLEVIMDMGKDGLPIESACRYAVIKVNKICGPSDLDQITI